MHVVTQRRELHSIAVDRRHLLRQFAHRVARVDARTTALLNDIHRAPTAGQQSSQDIVAHDVHGAVALQERRAETVALATTKLLGAPVRTGWHVRLSDGGRILSEKLRLVGDAHV